MKDFYQYDPVTNSWDTIPKTFPGVRRNYVPSFTIGDNAYFGTGSNGTNLADIWGYEWKITAGINETLNPSESIVIYPNPTSDVVRVILNNNQLAQNPTFTIFQLNGKHMSTTILYKSNQEINVSELADGVYLSTITDGQGHLISTTKIVKN